MKEFIKAVIELLRTDVSYDTVGVIIALILTFTFIFTFIGQLFG